MYRNHIDLPRSDNIQFIFKPMYCHERYKYFTQISKFGDEETFNKNCVDLTTDEKPQIRVTSSFVKFNITNSMSFENIEFTGVDMLYKV